MRSFRKVAGCAHEASESPSCSCGEPPLPLLSHPIPYSLSARLEARPDLEEAQQYEQTGGLLIRGGVETYRLEEMRRAALPTHLLIQLEHSNQYEPQGQSCTTRRHIREEEGGRKTGCEAGGTMEGGGYAGSMKGGSAMWRESV